MQTNQPIRLFLLPGVICAALLIASCGQKGPLKLTDSASKKPAETAAAQQEIIEQKPLATRSQSQENDQ